MLQPARQGGRTESLTESDSAALQVVISVLERRATTPTCEDVGCCGCHVYILSMYSLYVYIYIFLSSQLWMNESASENSSGFTLFNPLWLFHILRPCRNDHYLGIQLEVRAKRLKRSCTRLAVRLLTFSVYFCDKSGGFCMILLYFAEAICRIDMIDIMMLPK